MAVFCNDTNPMELGDLEGKRYVLTGSNTGIGFVTARELVASGAHVVMACRNEEKARCAMAKITEQTGRDTMEFLSLDLSNLAQVKVAALGLVAEGKAIDCLINNAGIAGQRGLSADGFEIHFAVNHLGSYLFTLLLLPALEAMPSSRIVHVASRAHTRVSRIDFSALTKKTKTMTGFREYCVSKLCNVLFSMELAKRLPEQVSTHALHPGVVKSEIWRRVPWPIRPLMSLGMISVEQGAQTSLYCATEPSLATQSGLYYVESEVQATNPAATEDLALRLWQMSETWCSAHL